MIIDAHAHLVPAPRGHIARGDVRDAGFGWVTIGTTERLRVLPPTHRRFDFSVAILLELMNYAGVDRMVLLQGPFYGDFNNETSAAVAHYPTRFLGAGLLDPWATESRTLFTRLTTELGYRCIKLELSRDWGLSGLRPGLSLDDPAIAWLWDQAENLAMTITLDLGPIGESAYQTAAVAGLAKRHPGLRFVLPHLGNPNPAAERSPQLWQQWRDQISLGQLPNVWFDLSALPHRANEPYPFPSVARWIHMALEEISADRLLWGTDVPGLLTAGTYPQLLDATRVHLKALPAPVVDGILGLNALQAYPFTH